MESQSRWPVVLTSGDVTLRPLRFRDRGQWTRIRNDNRQWLERWEATLPRIPGVESPVDFPRFFQMVIANSREGRAGRSLSLIIWSNGRLVGQITMGGIIYGALRGAHIGYWIDSAHANQGIMTKAVEMMTRYGFDILRLHRIEINLRPENDASRRVAEKSGYHLEGERPRFLHIDGQWRDHLCYVRENPDIS
jgi:ribosomal-protein-alanine N-acetyltransferase